MALLYHDGFDSVDTGAGNSGTTYLGRAGWTGTLTSNGGTGRKGTGVSLQGGPTAAQLNLGAAKTTLIVGFAMQPNVSTGVFDILTGLIGGLTQWKFTIDIANQVIKAYQGTSTLLGTSPTSTSIAINTWAYLEFKVKTDGSTGTVDVQINGTNILSLTGQNTKAQSSAGVDAIVWSMNSRNADDLYICDATGSSPWNDFLGDVQSICIRPSADGTVAWTPNSGSNNYSRVNEQHPDDDTTYVSTTASSTSDNYTMDDIDAAASVLGVTLVVVARKTDAGLASVKPQVKIGSTTYDGSTFALGTSYQFYRSLMETSPATSAQWTASEVNGAAVGMESV